MQSIYKAQIIKLHSEGKTFSQIAKEVGCSKQLVRYYVIPKMKNEHVNRNIKRKKDINMLLKKLHGNQCRKCGYNRCENALDFHHVDPETKTSAVHDYVRRALVKEAREEANKCILLCSNCHREFHAGLISLEGLRPFHDIVREDDTVVKLLKGMPGEELRSTP